MPAGGYRSLITKKRLAATAAAYGAMTAKMLSGANRQRRRGSYGVKPRTTRPRKVVVDIVSGQLSTAPAPKVKRALTAKQIAGYAKARATRAAKKGGVGPMLAYGEYF